MLTTASVEPNAFAAALIDGDNIQVIRHISCDGLDKYPARSLTSGTGSIPGLQIEEEEFSSDVRMIYVQLNNDDYLIWDSRLSAAERLQILDEVLGSADPNNYDPFAEGDIEIKPISPEQHKRNLLYNYAQREPKQFIQYDVFTNQWGDTVTPPDEDGDCIFSGPTYELMKGSDTRILLNPDVSSETAARALRKIADLIEREGLKPVIRLVNDESTSADSDYNPFAEE